jgi:repressor of nif and glnA expression
MKKEQTATEKVLEINDRLLDMIESFEPYALDLVYLYPAILRDSYIELDPLSNTLKLLKDTFSSKHFIWKYVKIVEDDGYGSALVSDQNGSYMVN